MPLGILLFPRKKKERDTVTKALIRDFPDVRVETADQRVLLALLERGNSRLVLSALHPAEADAHKLLEEVKSHRRECPVIWYAGSEEDELEVPALAAAMRSGLDDYVGCLERPYHPLEAVVRQALDRAARSRTAEAALQQSEHHYRALFENNPQPMWVFDPVTLRFLAVNEAALVQYGYTREEFLSLHAGDIRPKEDIPAFMDEVARVREHIERGGIWRHRKKDGTELEVQISGDAVEVGGREAVMVMANDVTELRRADRALRESEQRYRLLFEGNPQPMWVMDMKTYEFLAINDAAIRHYGYSRREFLSMKAIDIRPVEDIPKLMERTRQIRERTLGEMGDAGVWRHIKQDGTAIAAHITCDAPNFLGP